MTIGGKGQHGTEYASMTGDVAGELWQQPGQTRLGKTGRNYLGECMNLEHYGKRGGLRGALGHGN